MSRQKTGTGYDFSPVEFQLHNIETETNLVTDLVWAHCGDDALRVLDILGITE